MYCCARSGRLSGRTGIIAARPGTESISAMSCTGIALRYRNHLSFATLPSAQRADAIDRRATCAPAQCGVGAFSALRARPPRSGRSRHLAESAPPPAFFATSICTAFVPIDSEEDALDHGAVAEQDMSRRPGSSGGAGRGRRRGPCRRAPPRIQRTDTAESGTVAPGARRCRGGSGGVSRPVSRSYPEQRSPLLG